MRSRKCFLGLCSLVLLPSCVSTQTISNSQSVSSSKSEFVSSSDSTSRDQKKEIDDFLVLLQSKEGKVAKRHTESVSTADYLTDAEPLEVKMRNEDDAVRYASSKEGPIVVQNGNYSVFESENGSYGTPSAYTIQTFHKDDRFYRITHYDDPQEASYKTTLPYSASYEEQNLSLSLPNEEIPLFATLIIDLSYGIVDPRIRMGTVK